MSSKQHRQAALLRCIRRSRAHNQEALVRVLASEGHAVTQASVSRDLRELGVVKAGGRYVRLEEVRTNRRPVPDRTLVNVLSSVTPAGANLLVAKTPPGGAPLVASQLDRAGRKELVGSVAGDDTILLVVRSRADQGRLLSWLRTLVRKEQE